jgi:hypothetical protein
MTTPHSHQPRDEDIDALLARRYRDTSQQFEARWIELKRELRREPRHQSWWTLFVRRDWLALAGTAAVAAVLAVVVWRRDPAPRDTMTASASLAELFAMDAVLVQATALLDEENREALLHLPAEPKPRI